MRRRARIKAGAARDHFLGFRAVSGRGEIFKAGGKVIKNVTGYDLPKLMAGSYGTLAARPETVATLLFTNIEPAAAGHLMTAALGSPHEVSGAAYLPKGVAVPGAPPEGDGIIALRLEGPAQSVEFRRDSLIREHVTDGVCETLSGSEAIAFWRAIGEAAPLSGLAGRAVWRISVAPARGAELGQEISRALDALWFLDWGGGLLWAAVAETGDAGAEIIRAAIRGPEGRDTGHATLVKGSPALRGYIPVFEPQPAPLAALSRRVKDAFDPAHILNPGRMVEGSRSSRYNRHWRRASGDRSTGRKTRRAVLHPLVSPPGWGRGRSSMAEFRTLRAGVFLPPFHPNDEDPLLCMERDFELMQWLDKLGFAEAWIGEHHSGGYEIYGQPELFIATAAERTRHIRLGTGVISLPYHHPLMVADRIVQLDYQTRGRAMFGFGPGLLPSDAMMLGIDPETQRDRMADAIDIITRLLDGEIITQQTDWYTMREARLHLRPYTKPRPHLAIASAVTPYGGKLAGRYDLGMLCVMAGSPNGYDTLDYNWDLACTEAAAQGRVMDRSVYRVMAPFHIAETREKAIENVRAGFAKWELYSYSVNPEGGAAIGMPSIEAINEGGRGAIGTPDDALRVLENYWTKTGGFGCILLLAHDWADWEATRRSYELFARYVLPRFEERSAWRSQSMDWMRANREAFSAKRKAAAASAVERHFAVEEAKRKGLEAAK